MKIDETTMNEADVEQLVHEEFLAKGDTAASVDTPEEPNDEEEEQVPVEEQETSSLQTSPTEQGGEPNEESEETPEEVVNEVEHTETEEMAPGLKAEKEAALAIQNEAMTAKLESKQVAAVAEEKVAVEEEVAADDEVEQPPSEEPQSATTEFGQDTVEEGTDTSAFNNVADDDVLAAEKVLGETRAAEDAAATAAKEAEELAKRMGEEKAEEEKATKEKADKAMLAEEHAKASDESITTFYSLDELKAGVDGVDHASREQHLAPVDFEELFDMRKEKFNDLKNWKKEQLKKKVGLW